MSNAEFIYPPTSRSLYETLYAIGNQRISTPVTQMPSFQVHSPNNFEKIHLSRAKDMACRVGGSAQHCANASAELELNKSIHTISNVAEILPAHGQLPSHVHVSQKVVSVPESEFNRQLSLEAVHADLKHKFPQSYRFFTEPWTVRAPVCSGIDQLQSPMIQDRQLPQNCLRAARKF